MQTIFNQPSQQDKSADLTCWNQFENSRQFEDKDNWMEQIIHSIHYTIISRIDVKNVILYFDSSPYTNL